MNLLITGATGYIGFNVSPAFRRAGHTVIGLVLGGSPAAMLEKKEKTYLASWKARRFSGEVVHAVP